MPAAQLSADGRRLIKQLEKERKKKRFCDDNCIDIRTLNALRNGDYRDARVVERVEAHLQTPKVTPEVAFRVVATNYGMSQAELAGRRSRQKQHEEARMILALILLENARISKREIQVLMNYKDHTGPHNTIKTIRAATDPHTKQRIEEIRAKVRAAF